MTWISIIFIISTYTLTFNMINLTNCTNKYLWIDRNQYLLPRVKFNTIQSTWIEVWIELWNRWWRSTSHAAHTQSYTSPWSPTWIDVNYLYIYWTHFQDNNYFSLRLWRILCINLIEYLAVTTFDISTLIKSFNELNFVPVK